MATGPLGPVQHAPLLGHALSLTILPTSMVGGLLSAGPRAPRLPGRRGGSLSQSSYRSAEIDMFGPSAERFPPDQGFQRGSGKVAGVRATRRRPSTAAGLRRLARRSAGASEDASASVLGMTKGAGAPAQPEPPSSLLPRRAGRAPPSRCSGGTKAPCRSHRRARPVTNPAEGGRRSFSLFFLLRPREREDFPAWRDRLSGSRFKRRRLSHIQPLCTQTDGHWLAGKEKGMRGWVGFCS